MTKRKYWIGEVAKETGLSLRTIRYYEELGLLRPKTRTAGHFRLYAESDVVRLKAIQTLKNLGYPLKDIQAVMKSASTSKTGHELVTAILSDLQKQEKLAKKQLKRCRETLKSIDTASELLAKCLGCKRKPTKSHCLHCDVFPSGEEVPLIFQAAFA
jgi:DNA-binding transcriptional MerR regulator